MTALQFLRIRRKYHNTRERCEDLDIHLPRFNSATCQYCRATVQLDADGRWRRAEPKQWRPTGDL